MQQRELLRSRLSSQTKHTTRVINAINQQQYKYEHQSTTHDSNIEPITDMIQLQHSKTMGITHIQPIIQNNTPMHQKII